MSPKPRAGRSVTVLAAAWRRPNPVFSPQYQALVSILTDARRRAGVSQKTLAARIGRSPSHVARIEAGQRRLDTLEFMRLAQALNYSPTELFDVMVRRVRAVDASAAPDVGDRGGLEPVKVETD